MLLSFKLVGDKISLNLTFRTITTVPIIFLEIMLQKLERR